MLTVRKTLTEILLDVTNEEILDIAKQTVTKSRRKGSVKTLYIFYYNIN